MNRISEKHTRGAQLLLLSFLVSWTTKKGSSSNRSHSSVASCCVKLFLTRNAWCAFVFLGSTSGDSMSVSFSEFWVISTLVIHHDVIGFWLCTKQKNATSTRSRPHISLDPGSFISLSLSLCVCVCRPTAVACHPLRLTDRM